VPIEPDPALTPTQLRVRTGLLDLGGARPVFDPHLAARLLEELEARATACLDALGAPPPPPYDRRDRPLVVVHKRALAQIHQCERHWAAEEAAGFAWTAATARGAVAHKAIELGAQVDRQPLPADVVDLAIARLIDDERGSGLWLRTATEGDLAELRARATDEVTKFDDSFPPLARAWRPRLESRQVAYLAGGRVELSGKVDLALGKPVGCEARTLIVDLKTGRPSGLHAADLRFYALVETLRVGVPPFRVASFYLDSGTWHHEDVDEDLLWSTVRRVADGVDRLVALRLGTRQATETPGPPCRYCPARPECPPGQAWRPPEAWADPDSDLDRPDADEPDPDGPGRPAAGGVGT
jgi:hypothetical protein